MSKPSCMLRAATPLSKPCKRAVHTCKPKNHPTRGKAGLQTQPTYRSIHDAGGSQTTHRGSIPDCCCPSGTLLCYDCRGSTASTTTPAGCVTALHTGEGTPHGRGQGPMLHQATLSLKKGTAQGDFESERLASRTQHSTAQRSTTLPAPLRNNGNNPPAASMRQRQPHNQDSVFHPAAAVQYHAACTRACMGLASRRCVCVRSTLRAPTSSCSAVWLRSSPGAMSSRLFWRE